MNGRASGIIPPKRMSPSFSFQESPKQSRKFIWTKGGGCSVAKWCLTHCDPMDCSTPGFPVLHYLPEFAQTHVHRVGDVTQPSHPLPPPYGPVLNLSQHQGLCQWSVAHITWPNYWCFSFNNSSSSEYSGLISFRIGWFDFAVQGTLKSLLQHHNSKASIISSVLSLLYGSTHIHTNVYHLF